MYQYHFKTFLLQYRSYILFRMRFNLILKIGSIDV